MDGGPVGMAMDQTAQIFAAHELVDGLWRDVHQEVGGLRVVLLAGFARSHCHRAAFCRWAGEKLLLPGPVADLRPEGLVGVVFRTESIAVQESHQGAVALDARGLIECGPAGAAGQRVAHEEVPVARHEVKGMVISREAGQAVEQWIEDRFGGVVPDLGLEQVTQDVECPQIGDDALQPADKCIEHGGSAGIEMKIGDEVIGHRGNMIAGSLPQVELARWKGAR